MRQINRKSIMGGFIWLVLEKAGAQGVTFIVSIILSRILEPKDYGTIALISVFTVVLGCFVDSGFASALIQKKDADDVDFSSIFYVNIILCIGLYILTFLLAPILASFYGNSELTLLIRVLCISIIISGVKNIQIAYIAKNMLFKKYFFSTLGGTICAAIIGIIMAYKGFGIWALGCQSLANQIIDTLILWISVKWKPKLAFSLSRVKKLYSFGWKLFLASVISVLCREIRQLIIGKIYSAEDLSYYNRGTSFPNLIITNINSALGSVLFPVMADKQDDKEAIRVILRKSNLFSTYILLPLMTGLALCAPQFIRLILTEKWIFCVPYLRIFCVEYTFLIVCNTNLNAYQSIGRSDIYLRNEIVCKAIVFFAIVLTAWISVFAIALSSAIVTLISMVVNTVPNKKILDYGLFEQLKDMIPNLMLTFVMGGFVYLIGLVNISDIKKLVLQVFGGGLIYIIGSRWIKLEAYDELIRTIKTYFHRGRCEL